MQNKIKFYFISLLFILFSCGVVRQCTQEEIDKELNNGNTNQQVRIIELNHATMIDAFELAYNKSGCTGVGNGAAVKGNILNCDVQITVNTASGIAGQNPVVDKDAYSYQEAEDQQFQSTFNGTKNTTYSIKVPETGAFAIEYILTSKDCNQCCSGGLKSQCGAFGNTPGLYKEGKPKIRLQEVYLSANRPPLEQNIIPNSINQWGVIACLDCGACPEKKCY